MTYGAQKLRSTGYAYQRAPETSEPPKGQRPSVARDPAAATTGVVGRSSAVSKYTGEAPPPPNPTREGGAAASRLPGVPFREGNHSIVSLILQEAVRLHDAKNHDYATSGDAFANFRLSEMAGVEPWVGAVVRMGDKYARITGFAKTGRLAVTDEQVSDTLMDLLVYAAITLALYREKTSGGSEKPEPVHDA